MLTVYWRYVDGIDGLLKENLKQFLGGGVGQRGTRCHVTVPSGLGLGGLCLVLDGGGMDTAEKHDPLAILRCWGGVGV